MADCAVPLPSCPVRKSRNTSVFLIGGTGGTGLILLERMLEEGYNVSFYCRPTSTLQMGLLEKYGNQLTFSTGTLSDTEAMKTLASRKPCTVAIFTPGPGEDVLKPRRGSLPKDDMCEGVANMIDACSQDRDPGGKTILKRVILVSSLGVGDSRTLAPCFFRYLCIDCYCKHIFYDKKAQEVMVKQECDGLEDVDYEIIRPAKLVGYKTSYEIIRGTPGRTASCLTSDRFPRFLWRCLRPATLTDDKSTGCEDVQQKSPVSTILLPMSRSDLAALILQYIVECTEDNHGEHTCGE